MSGESGSARPPKGTPEYRVMIEAIEIAMAAPWKKGRASFAASIPWSRINSLRDALDAAEIDWRKAKAGG